MDIIGGLAKALHTLGREGASVVAVSEYFLGELVALSEYMLAVYLPNPSPNSTYAAPLVEKVGFVQTKAAELFNDIALTHYRVGLTYQDYVSVSSADTYAEGRSFRSFQNLLEMRRVQPLFFTTRVFELISGLVPDIGLVGIVEEVFTNSVGAEGGLWVTSDVDSLVDLAVLDDAFETAVMLWANSSFFISWIEYKGKTEYVSDSLAKSIPYWLVLSAVDYSWMFVSSTVR